jgi:DNA-binding transcriptional LysR family regulator
VDLYKLQTFVTVATFLNFNQAARALNCTQSTVSARVHALEDEVGVPLFHRAKKRVVLTEAGEKLLEYARKLLAIEKEALADINGERNPSGRLTLRIPEAFAATYLPTMLEEFRRSFPKVLFDVSSCATHNLEHELQIGSVDLAFLFAESLPSTILKSERILKAALAIVTHPGDPLARRGEIDARHLSSRAIFLPKAGCAYGVPFQQILAADVSEPLMVHEFTSIETIKRCVMQGAGLSVLPKCVVQKELARDELVELTWFRPLTIDVLMIWNGQDRIPRVLSAFMDIARKLAHYSRGRDRAGHVI